MTQRAPRSAVLPLACLLALLAGIQGASQADDLAAKKAEILFKAKVSRAIQNGARWVVERQQKDGSFALEGNPQDGAFPQSRHRFGVSALCLYTLADCGYGADHKVVKKALAYVRKHYRSYLKGDHWPQASAYSLALLVLGLHDLYVKPANRARLEQRDRYGLRKRDDRNPCGYPTWARATIEQILDWFMANEAETGLFRYPGGFDVGTRPPRGPGGPGGGRPASHYGDEDLSNTQYVLLALWAGSRCGYAISTEQLERIAKRLLAYQARGGESVPRVEDPRPPAPRAGPRKGGHAYADPKRPGDSIPQGPIDRARGFPYTLGAPITGSMTTAGLSSLVIVKAMLMERSALSSPLRTLLDRGIWDAIAWLQRNFRIDVNPGLGSTWQYYYLYGLERACVIAGKQRLGAHDWYREGAEMLVADQTDDGRWAPAGQLGMFGGGPMGGGSPYRTDVLDTCFALLFLKRATLKPTEPVLGDPRPVTGGRADRAR